MTITKSENQTAVKVEYLTPLIVEVFGDDHHILYQPFSFKVNDVVYEIPAGFITDFASVPRWIFTYLVAGGRGKKEAVPHDWFYRGGAPVSKKFADEVFYASLKKNPDVNGLVAWLMYIAVKFGGKGEFK